MRRTLPLSLAEGEYKLEMLFNKEHLKVTLMITGSWVLVMGSYSAVNILVPFILDIGENRWILIVIFIGLLC